MTQQEKQVNYMGPFITMVFLFFIVGFLTTANTQFQGPLKETFLAEVGGLKNTFATLITFSWFLAYPVCGRVHLQGTVSWFLYQFGVNINGMDFLFVFGRNVHVILI